MLAPAFFAAALACMGAAAARGGETPVEVRVRQTSAGPRVFVDGRAVRPRFVYVSPACVAAISDVKPYPYPVPFVADADTDDGRIEIDGFAGDDPMWFSNAALVDETACVTNALSGAGETRTRHYVLGGLRFEKGHRYLFAVDHRATHFRTYFRHRVTVPGPDGGRRELPLPYGETFTETARMAAASGVDFVTFSTDTSWGCKDWWSRPGGPAAYGRIDAMCEKLIAANPRVLLVPRVNADAPEWMLEADPSLKMRFDRGFTVEMSSVSARSYRRAACVEIERLTRHLRRRFPRNFAGLHVSGQNSAEWFYMMSQTEDLSGYDVHTRNSFREWLARRGDPDAATAEVPTPESRRKLTATRFRDSVADRRVVDFCRFRQEEIASFLGELGAAIRRGSDGKSLALFFYGYTWELAGVPAGSAETGHFALEWLLKNCGDSVDGFSAPFSYGGRKWPGSAPIMGAAETIMRSGHLWINEDDTRTFREDLWDRFVLAGAGGERHSDPQISLDMLARNASFDILRGYGDWWMDLMGRGWYADDRLWRLRKELNALDDAMLARRRPYSPEIAVCANEESFLYAGWGSAELMWARMARDGFNACGTTYGQYLLNDVLDNPPSAKLFYIPVAENLSDLQRARLDALKSTRTDAVFVENPAPQDLTAGAIAERASRAGAHIYVRPSVANVCAAEGHVAVQALKDGEIEIDLGDGDVRKVTFRRGETRILRRSGEGVSSSPARFISPASKRGGCDGAVFERSFANRADVRRAVWRTTAQGVYEAYLNGKRVGNDFLKPGFTESGKCRHVYSYDVTEMLRRGKGEDNHLSATVTPGWWCDAMMQSAAGTPWQTGEEVAFWGELVLEFDDGTSETVSTDEKWLASYSGPVVAAGIYEGEVYDAQRRPQRLRPARINDEFRGELRPAAAKITLRRDLTLKPHSLEVAKGTEGASDDSFGRAKVVARYGDGDCISLEPGETLVVDFGQNCAAVPSFFAQGVPWAKITVRHAEMLNESNGEHGRGNDGPAGTPYLASLRSARAAFVVTPGEGERFFQPRHTFFGYRYLAVTTDEKVALREFRSTPVSSISRDMMRGEIATGDARVNRLIENIRWGMLSNYLSIPTDCPQRDERMGWTADTQVFMKSAMYLADVYEFLGKYLADLRDAQFEDGLYPCFVPNVRHVFRHWASAGWTDAGVMIPYRLWKWYGRREVVDLHWDSMSRYMRFLASHEEPYQINHGDWLAFEHVVKKPDGTDGEAPDPRQVKLLNACFRIWTDMFMKEMAEATGRMEDARHYAEEERRHRTEFSERYVCADGTLKAEFKGQCNDLYMLKLGLCGDEAAAEATKRDLVSNIKAHGNRLQTGFLGTAILMPTLTFEANAPELAYTLLLQDRFPSWLYSVEQGATTIWERWNGYTKEKGFGPVIMNSFNHYAYGCVLEWLFAAAAGIRQEPGGIGWKRFVLAPVPDRRIGSVDAAFVSPEGRIASSWQYVGDGWTWSFEIPAGTTAMVTPPGGTPRIYGPGCHKIGIERLD